MSAAPEPRVVVADDHPVFRAGLATALVERGIVVCATVGTGEEALAAVDADPPDVVLMDLAMPGIGGVEATRRLADAHSGVAVVVLTMSDDDSSLAAALRAGARGYLLKESTAEEVVHALRAVAVGQAVIGAGLSERVLGSLGGGAQHRSRAFPQLTARELDVLELMARGLANEAIASRLGLAEKTVRNNVSMVLTKLAVTSRAEAVARARDAGVGE